MKVNGRRRKRGAAKQRDMADNKQTGAFVNLNSASRRTPNDAIRAHGKDRFKLIIDTNNPELDNTILARIPVLPTLSERLGELASAFQEIKYESLKMVVNAGGPTAVSGIYVAGFVADAVDDLKPTGNQRYADVLIPNKGSVSKKWFEDVTIPMYGQNGWFYTSEDPTRVAAGTGPGRLSSPGSFFVVCDIAPDQRAPITIDLEWDVRFRNPTINQVVSNPATIPVNGPGCFAANTHFERGAFVHLAE